MKNRFIFFPQRGVPATPADVGLAFEDVAFTASDGVRLHGWWIPREGARHTLLWFHGNAGNIGGRVGGIADLSRFPVNLFVFDYRGYGASDGRPSEAGVYLDADAALAVVEERFGVSRGEIVLYGRSLGGAVAIDLAARKPGFAGVVIVGAFNALRDMAPRAVPLPFVGLVVRKDFDSAAKIGGVKGPFLFVHGTADDVVPIELGRRLFDAAPEPKTWREVEGADHDRLRANEAGFGPALRTFLADLPAPVR